MSPFIISDLLWNNLTMYFLYCMSYFGHSVLRRTRSLLSLESNFLISDRFILLYTISLKDALLGLKKCLATESPLKMMKIASYFILKSLFVLKIFKFLS